MYDILPTMIYSKSSSSKDKNKAKTKTKKTVRFALYEVVEEKNSKWSYLKKKPLPPKPAKK